MTRAAVALVAAVLVMHASGAFADVGDISTFTDPAGNVSQPECITTGPDGALWFTNFANGRIGRITTAGAITTFTDPADTVDHPFDIAVVHEHQQRRHRTHRDHRPATCPASSACRRGSALRGLSSYTATVPQSPPP